MPWNLSADSPIYLQLVEHLKTDIVSGVYKAGEKIPSVRDLASLAGVNPNTMQKALTELERDGLLYSERTSGRYVSEDPSLIQKMKASQAGKLTAEYLKKMRSLGLDYPAILQTIQEQNECADASGAQGRK